jgi:hypothetical protein
LRVHVPRFLTPRRKYEVDESKWLVRFGRPKVEFMLRLARKSMPIALSTADSIQRTVVGGGHKMVLFFQWRRMPKEWELSFVTKMKSMESRGISFPEILRTDLPSVLGEVPSDVLLRWVGRKARSQPKRFVKAVADTFGPSGKPIIIGLENALDPERMLQTRREPEEQFQSLIDAIQKADAEKASLAEYAQESDVNQLARESD